MKATNQIKVDRKTKDKTHAITQALNILKQGDLFGIFPEGTRSRTGQLQKAYTGVAKLVLKAKVPIIPVGITGTYEILSAHDKFPKLKKCQFKIAQPIYLDKYYGQEDDKEVLRKITDDLMKQIGEMVGEEYKW